MKAREIMTVSVVTVHADTPVREAAALLTERAVTSLPVLDEGDRLVGIVSEVDLIRDRMPHDARSDLRLDEHDEPNPAHLVRDVMSRNVVCLGGDADGADLAAAMSTNNVRAVPIVDGSRLIGIVSRRDLLRTLLRDDAVIRTDIVSRVEDYTGHARDWDIRVDDGVATIRGQFDDCGRRDIITQLARTVPGVLRVHIDPERLPDRPQTGATDTVQVDTRNTEAWSLLRHSDQRRDIGVDSRR